MPTLLRTLLPESRLATIATLSGAALLPWICVLAEALPATTEAHNWSTAWIGLDALIAAGLLGTGALLRRADPRAAPVAAATAALLLADAWFDILTAAPGLDRTIALTMAGCAELPLATLCALPALRATAPPTHPEAPPETHLAPHQPAQLSAPARR
ncbi:hypothetical protein [Embleya sp. AB8]|uniref:hypothetical protein n=1 Tax=Embleya sp. AB8 TaxID=3156304 RepID=UPI003C781638